MAENHHHHASPQPERIDGRNTKGADRSFFVIAVTQNGNIIATPKGMPLAEVTKSLRKTTFLLMDITK
jgi:hypothetical protein